MKQFVYREGAEDEDGYAPTVMVVSETEDIVKLREGAFNWFRIFVRHILGLSPVHVSQIAR